MWKEPVGKAYRTMMRFDTRTSMLRRAVGGKAKSR